MSGNNVIKFKKTKKSAPDMAKKGFALYSEGACLDGQNKDNLALKKYMLAEKYGYKSSDLYSSMARIYNVLGDYEKAKLYAQKAIDIDEEYDYPYYLMGGACYELEDYDNSLKYYLLAEKYGLNYSVVMYRDISEVYTKVEPDNIIKPLEYATKAISLDPEDAYSHYWKGWIYFKHDEFKQALKYYEKAEKLGYYSFSFYYEVSYSYTMIGELKKALIYANKCIFIDKDDSLGYYRKAWAYYNAGEYEKAKPLYILAEEKGCEYADMYASLGYIYQLEGNFERAVECCKKAIKLDKYYLDGYTQCGNVYAALKNDYKTGIEYYKKAYKFGKDFNEFFYLNFGMLYYMLNRHSMALKFLNEGLERYPKNYDLISSKVATLQMKKKYKEAQKLTRELVSLEPDNAWNNYNLALCCYNQKVKDRNYDKVISLLEGISSEDVLASGGCYAILSFAYYEKKIYDMALMHYLKFYKTNFVNEFMIKNHKILKRYYKRLLKKYPENSELEELGNTYSKYLKDE